MLATLTGVRTESSESIRGIAVKNPPLIRNRGIIRGGFLNMVYRFSKNLIFERFRENHSKNFSASGQIGE